MFGDVIAVDIDGCVEDGKLNDMAAEIVDALDTYAEYSISGTRIHMWIRAPGFVYDAKRYYINNQKAHMEVYLASVTKKFIVTTGNALNSKDINEFTDAFKEISEKYMVRPYADKVNESKVKPRGSYLSGQLVLEKMFASNPKAESCYCSNQAKDRMSPKTLQYLMGHSDISVTMNVYIYFGFNDAEEELKRMKEFRKAQADVEKKNEKPMSQTILKAI